MAVDPLPAQSATHAAALSSAEPGTAALDVLIPGDAARWPPFSAAVDAADFMAGLEAPLREALRREPADVAGMASWERDAPIEFAAALTAAYRAYYAAPAVAAVVRTLADEGPREQSALFDPQLVAGVIAADRGRRRL